MCEGEGEKIISQEAALTGKSFLKGTEWFKTCMVIHFLKSLDWCSSTSAQIKGKIVFPMPKFLPTPWWSICENSGG